MNLITLESMQVSILKVKDVANHQEEEMVQFVQVNH